MKLTKYVTHFHLNGGVEPPRYPGGLAFNPFPSIPIYGIDITILKIQKMSSLTFSSRDEVEAYLSGIGMENHFCKGIADLFRHGELVKVTFESFFDESNQCVGWRFPLGGKPVPLEVEDGEGR